MDRYFVPDFDVRLQGLTMAAGVKSAVTSVSYEGTLDQASMCQLTLDNRDLRLTDHPLFQLGTDVELHMGYAGDVKPMMLGEVTAIQPSFPESAAPTLSVTAYDKSHRLRHNHRNRSYPLSNASTIAAQIAAENLLVPVVDPTPVSFENKTQNGSDMALLQELAKRTFFETYVHWDKLYFRAPRPQTELVTLVWGQNLSSFSPRVSTSGQKGLVTLRDYDQKLAQVIVGIVPLVAGDFDLDAIVERLGNEVIDQLVAYGSTCITDESVGSFPDAAAFGKSILQELLEGMYQASGTCIGLPELRAGDLVDIRGVGKRFSGSYRIRSVAHTLDDSGYRTRFEVTQRAGATMTQLLSKAFQKLTKPPSSVVGTVVRNDDPEGLGRVQLTYPSLGETVPSSWARVVQPDTGTYFLPDVGEDVFVSFEKGDLDRPVVTGAFWNVKKTPPEEPTLTNQRKVIQSRSGHRIVFDDSPTEGGFTLESAGGSRISGDADGNLTIMAKGDLTLNAEGDITIQSGSSGKIHLNP